MFKNVPFINILSSKIIFLKGIPIGTRAAQKTHNPPVACILNPAYCMGIGYRIQGAGGSREAGAVWVYSHTYVRGWYPSYSVNRIRAFPS
jgi:hypothetical protein